MKYLVLIMCLGFLLFSCGDEVIEDKGKGQEGGIKKTYYGNGQIKSESKYKNDTIKLWEKFFYKNGQLESEFYYSENVLYLGEEDIVKGSGRS